MAKRAHRTPASKWPKVSGQTIQGAPLLTPPVRGALCGAFSCLRMLSPGHRDMGFHRYREALIVSIRAEGCQDVVA
jgi:hypothetical protein